MIPALPTRDRRWRPALGCAVVLCWARLVAAAPSPELVMAHAWLAEGRHRQAAAVFQTHLEAHPDDPEAMLGLARAWAAVHRCSGALDLLRRLRRSGPWTARAAAAEGDCRWASGDLSGALAAYEEAVWLQPRQSYAWMQLEAARRALGDDAGAAVARDELLVLPAGPLIVVTAEADEAVARALPDADAHLRTLAAFRTVGSAVEARVALLDGRRWLDVGWPEEAARVLLDAIRVDLHGLEPALWYAEALRRTGDPARARASLARPAIGLQEPTPLAHAIRARIETDLGDLDAAAAELEGLPDLPEVLASRWYLARARGGPHRALAERWASVDPGAPRRSLSLLLPVEGP